jgi:hypothetical protein
VNLLGGNVPIQYTSEFGSYYLIEDGNIRHMTDQVAIAFAEQDLCVLQYGPPADVLAWWARRRPSAEFLFGPVSVATLPRNFPLEDLNRIIGTRRLDASVLTRAELSKLGLL